MLLTFGGPDGEMGTSMHYPSQRCAMPYKGCKGALIDMGTEELTRLGIVATVIHQLTKRLTADQLVEQGFGSYYIDHATGIWLQVAGGAPFSVCEFQSKGGVITDLHEDMIAEQKARNTHDNIPRVIKDCDACEPIKFLREREVIHYQRFGELLRITWKKLDSRNSYAFSLVFDVPASSYQDQMKQM